MTHLERTLKCFKDLNFIVSKVEHFNTFAGIRQDLFGFLDVLALHPAHGTIGVQVCGSDWSPHIRKMTDDRRESLLLWLASGNRCILIGWRNLKKEGWTPRLREFTLADDFPEVTPEILIKLKAKNLSQKNLKNPLTEILG